MSRKKRKEKQFKTKFKENYNLQVIKGGQLETITRQKEVVIVPRNFKQDDLLDLLNNSQKHIVFATGPAGTGKTYTGVAMAVKALKEKEIKKIILTRPAVEAGENLGYLRCQ